MYLQKVINKKPLNKNKYLVNILKVSYERKGPLAGSGSVSLRYGSGSADPHQNVTDPGRNSYDPGLSGCWKHRFSLRAWMLMIDAARSTTGGCSPSSWPWSISSSSTILWEAAAARGSLGTLSRIKLIKYVLKDTSLLELGEDISNYWDLLSIDNFYGAIKRREEKTEI